MGQRPEQAKPSAGVGAIAEEGLCIYTLTDPIDDYIDAENTGRCKIICMDVKGITYTFATIYGWTGGREGSEEAARTDDLIAIIQMQFNGMEPGPKAICGTSMDHCRHFLQSWTC